MRDKLACNVAGESPEKKKRTKKAEGKAFTVLKTKKNKKTKGKRKKKEQYIEAFILDPTASPAKKAKTTQGTKMLRKTLTPII